MICAPCSDKGEIVDMYHLTDTEAVNLPGDPDGYGEVEVCWYECPKCAYQEDCSGACRDPLD
jgi:hypothetical protein